MATKKAVKKGKVSRKDLLGKQERLAYELKKKIAESGLSNSEFYARNNLSIAEGSGIVSNNRAFAHSDKDLVKRICKALGQTPLTFYMWVGLLEVSDLINEENLDEALNRGYEAIVNDKRYSFLAPSKDEWKKTPQGAKSSLIIMYQSLAQKKVLNMAKLEVEPSLSKR